METFFRERQSIGYGIIGAAPTSDKCSGFTRKIGSPNARRAAPARVGDRASAHASGQVVDGVSSLDRSLMKCQQLIVLGLQRAFQFSGGAFPNFCSRTRVPST